MKANQWLRISRVAAKESYVCSNATDSRDFRSISSVSNSSSSSSLLKMLIHWDFPPDAGLAPVSEGKLSMSLPRGKWTRHSYNTATHLSRRETNLVATAKCKIALREGTRTVYVTVIIQKKFYNIRKNASVSPRFEIQGYVKSPELYAFLAGMSIFVSSICNGNWRVQGDAINRDTGARSEGLNTTAVMVMRE